MSSDQTSMRKDPSENMKKLGEIVETLTQQSNIIRESQDRWLHLVIDMQKDMKYRVDMFRSMEDEINLQKKIINGIVEADTSGHLHISQAISELHELALATLRLIEKMKTTENPELILQIQSANSQFKMNLLDYIQYLEMELGKRGGKSLEFLDGILEDVNELEQMLPYVIQTEK